MWMGPIFQRTQMDDEACGTFCSTDEGIGGNDMSV